MIKKTLFSALALGCISTVIYADDVSLMLPAQLEVGYDVLPAKPLTHPQQGTFQDDVTVRAETFHASAVLPQINLSDKTLWVNGLVYKNYAFNFDGWDSSQQQAPPDQLHALQYLFLMNRTFTDTQSLSLFLLPGLESDFQNIAWNQARLDGGLLANFKCDRSVWGFGVVYASNFGKPLFLPALTWRWSDGDKWRVNVSLPAKAEMWYALNEQVQTGLLLGFSGGQFRIGQTGAYQNDRVRTSSGRFGPGIRWKLPYGFVVRGEAGIAFARRYGIYDGNNEVQDLDSANSGFIQGEISYRWGAGRDGNNGFEAAGL